MQALCRVQPVCLKTLTLLYLITLLQVTCAIINFQLYKPGSIKGERSLKLVALNGAVRSVHFLLACCPFPSTERASCQQAPACCPSTAPAMGAPVRAQWLVQVRSMLLQQLVRQR